MNFSDKLKQLRNEKGITQQQFAEQSGIALSSIRNYENGRLPDTHQLKTIKSFYDVSYEFLLEDECKNRSNTNIEIYKVLRTF